MWLLHVGVTRVVFLSQCPTLGHLEVIESFDLLAPPTQCCRRLALQGLQFRLASLRGAHLTELVLGGLDEKEMEQIIAWIWNLPDARTLGMTAWGTLEAAAPLKGLPLEELVIDAVPGRRIQMPAFVGPNVFLGQ
jgi:hypothetical protein